MQIWPAIDLKDGKCVRLRQGDYARQTVYGDDPAAMARRWVGEGGRRLHLVDLDAAKHGGSPNREAIRHVAQAVDAPLQLGGGIRDQVDIERAFSDGVARVVVGTRAVLEPDWFAEMAGKYPQRLVLGLDAKSGLLATHGWQEETNVQAMDLVRRFTDTPLAGIVYTDIERDGMLKGPNLDALRELIAATEIPVIASGGISTLPDVERVRDTGAAGVIIGRALYDEQIFLSEAITVAGDEPAHAPAAPHRP